MAIKTARPPSLTSNNIFKAIQTAPGQYRSYRTRLLSSAPSQHKPDNRRAHYTSMNRRLRGQAPREITYLDAKIAKGGGTSSNLELLPGYLHEAKEPRARTVENSASHLVKENGYLRQEIVFYQEARNVMLEFHTKVVAAIQTLQGSKEALSERMALLEGEILRYWDIDLSEGDDDLTVL